MRANRHVARWALFAIGLGATAWPGAAVALTGQSLAYVTSANGIAVVDTGDNQVVATIPGPALPAAVSPDGKYVYAFAASTSDFVFKISVINASNNRVVATIPLDVSMVPYGVSLNQNSSAIAVSPDGTKVYATTGVCPSIDRDCSHPEAVWYALWVIDAASNKVVTASLGKGTADGFAFSPDGQHTYLSNYDPYYGNPQVLVVDTGNTIPFSGYCQLFSIAITPDGTHAYVPYSFVYAVAVAVIDTATGAVTENISVGPTTLYQPTLTQVAMSPNGKHVYVTSEDSSNVVVIDTASNAIVNTVTVGKSPSGVAVTPDGAHVYVSNYGSNNLSVIDTASNTVTATIPVSAPGAISIITPPEGLLFGSFHAGLNIQLNPKTNQDAFELASSFTVNSPANEKINPETEPVKLQVGPFIAALPIGSFKSLGEGAYIFEGVINGVQLHALIEATGILPYIFLAEAKDANLSGITNPVQVSLSIGNHAGLTSVNALR